MEVNSPAEFLHHQVSIDPNSKRDFSTYTTYRLMKPLTDYQYARVLVCVAHCDDESLFAGGLLRRLADQHCEIGIAVATDVAQTNAPRDGSDDTARQQRRLVAFGRACGMIGVSRTWLLGCDNCHQVASLERQYAVAAQIGERLRPVLNEYQPSVVLTHGREGEYGHLQHTMTNLAVMTLGTSPVWTFSAHGPLVVPVDLAWKKRLLDCYRYGTTQDAHWSPYFRKPDSPLEPWLGDKERFQCSA